MNAPKVNLDQLTGCWIDSAVPRTRQEIASKMLDIAMLLNPDADYSGFKEPPPGLNDEESEFWLEDVIYELDEDINESLNPHGYLASWEAGDYIVFHQSEYFSDPDDYFVK